GTHPRLPSVWQTVRAKERQAQPFFTFLWIAYCLKGFSRTHCHRVILGRHRNHAQFARTSQLKPSPQATLPALFRPFASQHRDAQFLWADRFEPRFTVPDGSAFGGTNNVQNTAAFGNQRSQLPRLNPPDLRMIARHNKDRN